MSEPRIEGLEDPLDALAFGARRHVQQKIEVPWLADVDLEVLAVEIQALGVDAKDHLARFGLAEPAPSGELGDSPFERSVAAHTQRVARVEKEERTATDDDASAMALDREHDLGEVAHVIARGESPDANELVDPPRYSLATAFVE